MPFAMPPGKISDARGFMDWLATVLMVTLSSELVIAVETEVPLK